MPIERPRQSPKPLQGISFDELLSQWHALNEGEAKDFMVLDRAGNPLLAKPAEADSLGTIIMRLKAEPQYELDNDPNAAPKGTRYTAYEYITDRDDVEFLNAYWDEEYFDQHADKARTYIPVSEFVQSHNARTPAQTPAASAEPALMQARDLPHIRKAKEITDTRREFRMKVAELLRADNEFSRRWHARFLRMQVMERFQELRPGRSEERFIDGMRLQQARQSFRGSDVVGKIENPDHVAPTLIIQLVQRTQPLVGDATVTYLSKPQAEDLAALVAEVENLARDIHPEFRTVLQTAKIEQVRVEILSWRERAESKYPLTIPIAGNAVPSGT